MQPSYLYNAKITNVVDGDTIDAVVDLGFNIYTKIRFRLYGIDTPEKTDKDPVVRISAMLATEFVRSALLDADVTIESKEKDKYGRWLGIIHMKLEQPTINEQLITLGLAKPYFGGAK